LEKKLYIKIITYDNFPYGGAPANLLRYFALALARENNDVEVILPTGNTYGDNIDINSKRIGNVDNVRYKHLCFKIHPKNYFGKFLDIIFGLFLPVFYLYKERFNNNLDKIILFDVRLSNLLFFLFIKLTLRRKLIVIVPEFYEKSQGRFALFSKLKWYNFYLGLIYLLRYADGYIVASNFLQKYIKDTLKVNKSILVLPNLMDSEIFHLSDIKPFISNKITIGYTGTPTRKDGVIDLIDSFGILNKKYPDTHLLIIGDNIDSKKSIIQQLKDHAIKLGVIENVTFTGLVSFKRIPELLNSCQILALTRPKGIFAEAGFPTKLGEYFACRKPVVITKVGDIPTYFVNEEHLVIVNPEDIESIVNGFEKLLNNKELGERICTNAYKWMDSNLYYKNMSGKLSEFITAV
jgi:glycosyltransferase involved in cell wall biosynthesis